MHRAVGDRPDNIWTGTLFDVSEQLDQAAQEKNRNGAGRWLNCRTAQNCGAGPALNSSNLQSERPADYEKWNERLANITANDLRPLLAGLQTFDNDKPPMPAA